MGFVLLRSNAALVTALACLVGSLGPAVPCAYHGGKGFSAVHPGSVDVAIAVQVAVEAGTLEAEASAPMTSMVAYHRMVKQIEQFRSLLEAGNRHHATPAFSLLLIESALWSRLTPKQPGIELAIHTAGPAGDEAVVLTTGAVIGTVLDGRLSTADAVHRGLIRVEAGIDAKLALFELLAAAKRP